MNKQTKEIMMPHNTAMKEIENDLSDEFWDEFIEFIETHDDLGVLLALKYELARHVDEQILYVLSLRSR
jgi:hypothetical protein